MTPAQVSTLRAAADRIVPADDYPSAGEAGAVDYVRRLLDRDLPDRWPELIEGFDRLDFAARQSHTTAFVNLSSDAQDALLAAEENSSDPAARRFFAWLVDLVLESYYADPANGGNAGAVSWQMVGYEPRVPGYDGGGQLGGAGR